MHAVFVDLVSFVVNFCNFDSSVIDVTTYIYFTLFDPLVYVTFLWKFFRSVQSCSISPVCMDNKVFVSFSLLISYEWIHIFVFLCA